MLITINDNFHLTNLKGSSRTVVYTAVEYSTLFN